MKVLDLDWLSNIDLDFWSLSINSKFWFHHSAVNTLDIVKIPMQAQRNRWVWLEKTLQTITTHQHKLNVSNISAVTDLIDESLKVGSWEHLEQIPTVTETFVQVQTTLVRNISAVTDLIWTKL